MVICDMYAPITERADRQVPGRDGLAPAGPRSRRADRDGVHGVRAPRGVGPARRPIVRVPLGVRPAVPAGLPAGPLPTRSRCSSSRTRPTGSSPAAASRRGRTSPCYLIARYCSPAHAAETAKVFLLDRHADGQLPYSAMTRVVRRRRCRDRSSARLDRRPLRGGQPGLRDGPRGRAPAADVRAPLRRGDRPPADRARPRPARRGRASPPRGGRRRRSTTWVRGGYEDPTFFRRLFRRDDGHDARRVPAQVRRRSRLTSAPASPRSADRDR